MAISTRDLFGWREASGARARTVQRLARGAWTEKKAPPLDCHLTGARRSSGGTMRNLTMVELDKLDRNTLYSTAALSTALGVPVSTLHGWRKNGFPLRYIGVGNGLYARGIEVVAWFMSRFA